jgi:hypothetical protein
VPVLSALRGGLAHVRQAHIADPGHAVFSVNARMRAGVMAALHPGGVKPTPPAAADHGGVSPARVFGHLPGLALPAAAMALYSGITVYLVMPFREAARVLARRHSSRQ